jgi:predicted metal-binding protein
VKFTPGRRGIVISSRTSIVAFVECDSCSGELWNQTVLAVGL